METCFVKDTGELFERKMVSMIWRTVVLNTTHPRVMKVVTWEGKTFCDVSDPAERCCSATALRPFRNHQLKPLSSPQFDTLKL